MKLHIVAKILTTTIVTSMGLWLSLLIFEGHTFTLEQYITYGIVYIPLGCSIGYFGTSELFKGSTAAATIGCFVGGFIGVLVNLLFYLVAVT